MANLEIRETEQDLDFTWKKGSGLDEVLHASIVGGLFRPHWTMYTRLDSIWEVGSEAYATIKIQESWYYFLEMTRK